MVMWEIIYSLNSNVLLNWWEKPTASKKELLKQSKLQQSKLQQLLLDVVEPA